MVSGLLGLFPGVVSALGGLPGGQPRKEEGCLLGCPLNKFLISLLISLFAPATNSIKSLFDVSRSE